MNKIRTKGLAFAVITALIIGFLPSGRALAAKKVTPKLSKSKVTLPAGSKKKITVKNGTKAKVKSVKWSVNKKGKKIVRLSKKSKKSVTIKTLKKGNATVKAKIRVGKKTYTRKIRVKVTKKKTVTADTQPADTQPTDTQPVNTQPADAQPTETPAAGPTGIPTASSTPVPVQTAPSVTKMPVSTEEPDSTPAVYGKAGEAAEYSKKDSNYTLDIDASDKVHEISDMLYGIFIEDINFAADGGLYAEMVKNRSFEFTNLASGNEKHGWSDVGVVTATVNKDDPAGCLNPNNPNYMVLTNGSDSPAGIANGGFLDGMAVNKDAKYDFSIWARGLEGYTGPIHVAVMKGTQILAAADIPAVTAVWTNYTLEMVSSETAYQDVKLQVTIDKGKAAVDMVSLFPQDTYKGRKNGLRKDLAQKLEELHPAFLRFPGGCVVEGGNLGEAYDWKDSIGVGPDGEPLSFNGTYGDIAARKQGQNLWTDENAVNDEHPAYMTYGLGFYEYFLLAEDLGAVGIPIVNCGISCMVPGNAEVAGDFSQYIQDALDLVEFCRGGKDTKWGAVRTALGHEEPFELKYIGIGNEQWGSTFYEHYEAFVEAFDKAKKADPELYAGVELMYSAGVDDGDSGRDYMPAYVEAANWLKEHPGKTISDFTGAIDHHYYNEPSWFLNHTDYYDEKNYSRDTANMTATKFGGGINVFLGEYASFSNTWNSGLAEAAYMTGLERNGDIVKMAAYAPLLGNVTRVHWAPDLIWFNNHTSTSSVNYYVQKVFSNNAGTSLLGTSLALSPQEKRKLKGKVGVGTWNTSAYFDNVKITDNDTGEVLAYDNFDSSQSLALNWQKVSDGSWSVSGGRLVQSSTNTNTAAYATTGSTVYFGDVSWDNYTYTLEATKTGGQEGFLIPIAVGSRRNNYFWNLGGWNNTTSCLQQVTNGVKSDQIAGTVKNVVLQTGKKYRVKVVVKDYNIKCYLDDNLYINYTVGESANQNAFQVVSTDETGDIIIKMVNVSEDPKTFAIDIAGAETIGSTAQLDLVAGNSLKDDNILEKNEVVTLVTSEVSGVGKQFNYTVPKYSVSVLRLKTK